MLKAAFALVPVLARAADRRHSIELIRAGADVHVRETFESAVLLGAEALRKLGTAPAEIAELSAQIRSRDQRRLELELVRGLHAGSSVPRRECPLRGECAGSARC